MTENLAQLNKELTHGQMRPTRFKLECDLFDISSNGASTELGGSHHIEIPCSTSILEDDTFEFHQDFEFEIAQYNAISFRFLDLQNWDIYFDKSKSPRIFLKFF